MKETTSMWTSITRRAMTQVARAAFGFALAIAAPLPCAAWIVSGQVTDAITGLGIANVDLDFEDNATGNIIFTPGDDTDANGFYAATVPTGTYRVFFNAPLGSIYFDDRADNVTVVSNRTLNMALVPGVIVSGYVKDTNGIGLPNVDLNFYNSATGENLGYGNDNTDAAGFYSVLVDRNLTYDVLYRPSQGDNHVAFQANDVVVGTTNIVRPDVVLAAGFAVTGSVLRKSNNAPVFDADIDVKNSVTGQAVTLGFDNTDANGLYQVVLVPGTYDLIAMPPAGQGLAGEVQPGVVVVSNMTAPAILLPNGFTLSGVVRDGANAPVFDANLDVVDVARGVEIPTTGDHTTATGAYSVVVGAGTYDLIYNPPPAMAAAATVVRNKVITGNTVQPTVVLLPGFVISGTVRRTGGATVANSDIDAVQTSDGFVYPTLNDDSGPGGAYSIRVPAGSYRFVADPPTGSGLVADTVVAVISANTVVNFELVDPAMTGVDDASGAGIVGGWLSEAWPNPSRGSTRVRLGIPVGAATAANARLSVYSAEGRLVRVLFDDALPAGERIAEWNGDDDAGRPVASGQYFLRFDAGRFHATTKTLILR
ncbi:MAG: FlgD immunoglobulin-like domain containing protein [bacterium]